MLRLAALCLLIIFGHSVQASPIRSALPGAELRGEAVFRLLGLPVYQARLFTPDGARLDWQSDMALELTYLRRLSQRDLVEGTLREMQRQGSAAPPRGDLNVCFSDVQRGDRFTSISDGPDRLYFYRNDTQTCTLNAPAIRRNFMSIFLGDNTRSRRFTTRLLGE